MTIPQLCGWGLRCGLWTVVCGMTVEGWVRNGDKRRFWQ